MTDREPLSARPRLLDLFCGAGGAAMGYWRAGFDVVGVDIAPQPNYPFEFIRDDALGFLACNVIGVSDYFRQPLPFDAIHASPPCQAFTSLSSMWSAKEHPDLIAPTRQLLRAAGLPYVIENVPGAPLVEPVTICGAALGLGTNTHDLARHRVFETSWPLMVPPCAHGSRPIIGIYGDHVRDRRRSLRVGEGQFTSAEGRKLSSAAMGLPESWTHRERSQAIPPAYTELIGYQLMQHLNAVAA